MEIINYVKISGQIVKLTPRTTKKGEKMMVASLKHTPQQYNTLLAFGDLATKIEGLEGKDVIAEGKWVMTFNDNKTVYHQILVSKIREANQQKISVENVEKQKDPSKMEW